MKKIISILFIFSVTFILSIEAKEYSYKIVDTAQEKFYSNDTELKQLSLNDDFFGQDASYLINPPSYTNNNDGTINDNVTGLMWQKVMGDKLTYKESFEKATNLELAGYTDWRVPSIKELYSLIQFTGRVQGQKAIRPFIDTRYFNQPLGKQSKGEREIDAQTWSSTSYVGKTMKNDETIFGVNFVDGRIKGYPKYNPRSKKSNKMYFRFVRGNKNYGKNNLVLNKNIVLDKATGLMWQQSDSNKGMNWKDALKYAKNLELGDYNDWRLPNAKELQSILDYTRSPQTNNSASINPIFKISSIINEANKKDYPYFWTSTTHLDGPVPQKNAVYIAFGSASGKMHGKIMDVHGAGSQRSDPKIGSPMSRGPQGDMIRVNNYVRCVRGGVLSLLNDSAPKDIATYSTLKNKKNTVSSSSRKNRFIIREDKNMDGKVSRSEFGGPSNHFNHFDKNNDGYISEEEAPQRQR